MNTNTNASWFAAAIETANCYRRMIDAIVEQLTADELGARPAPGVNSVAIILRHLGGNLRSRWTDFMTTDGEKPDRDRDSEFTDWEADIASLVKHFERGWSAFMSTLTTLDLDTSIQTVLIRGESHTVAQAIQRSLTHISYHVGQMAIIARQVHTGPWKWLTIAPGESAQHNERTWGTTVSRSVFAEATEGQCQTSHSVKSDRWDAALYLKYGDERTRPAVDLAARIKLDSPATVVDLGCGPGNSTQVLRSRWPSAEVIGIDNSANMIAAAREAFPEQSWVLADISGWAPQRSFDLVYSNAALQWIPNHAALMVQLFEAVSAGGVLAFQIPSSMYATVRTLIHEISENPKWTDRMDGPRRELTMESPSFYYDALCGVASKLDIWETEYSHVMESADAIVDWISSTGLRPFLAVLDADTEREQFVSEVRSRVQQSYEPRSDGQVLFRFRRTFVVAYR
ncbi:MAG: DinB family protein [Planctomycetaceae bacterium]|nr:DUF1572 family protein [Planctomycetales bacterium]